MMSVKQIWTIILNEVEDVFYFLKKHSMYNYADNSTVSYAHKHFAVLTAVVQSETEITLNWFDDNPGNFQAIVGGKSKKEGKDQESIQSSTTPGPGYPWENDNVTIRHHKRESRGQPFPCR